MSELKPQDFRIGNYYTFSKTAEDGLIYDYEIEKHGSEIFQIQSMDIQLGLMNEFIDGVLHYAVPLKSGGWCCSGIELKYVEPILLTEKLVRKCGFKKELDSVYRKNKSHLIEIIFHEMNELTITTQSLCLNNIKYLHQLQDIHYLLFGEELELKQ